MLPTPAGTVAPLIVNVISLPWVVVLAFPDAGDLLVATGGEVPNVVSVLPVQEVALEE